MPLRDIECRDCGEDTENVLIGIKEIPTCPNCGSTERIYLKISYPANYTIGGDNSASVRPNKSKATKESK